jgi:SAM-dependent methyltransferase
MTDERTDVRLQVRKLFDARPAAWASKYALDGRLAGRLTLLVNTVKFHVPAGGTVLGLGCSTGELAASIAASGIHAIGCDISPQMLSRAAAADSSGPIDWVQLDLDWQELLFAARTSDAIVASSVLEYVHDPDTVLRECHRVLRPGAVLLCTVPDLTHPVRWLECVGVVTAWASLVRALRRHSPRLNAYLAYLTISRQRHPARWWRTTAARTGLLTEAPPAHVAAQSPLRLLILRRPET